MEKFRYSGFLKVSPASRQQNWNLNQVVSFQTLALNWCLPLSWKTVAPFYGLGVQIGCSTCQPT